MKQVASFFFLWLLFAGIGAAIGYWAYSSPELDQLAERGVPVYGKVIAKEPDNHARIKYSFQVGGKEYFGAGYGGAGNLSFEQIEIGQSIVVFYDPQKPETSMAGYPQWEVDARKNSILFGMIVVPICPLLMLFILYWIFIHQRRDH